MAVLEKSASRKNSLVEKGIQNKEFFFITIKSTDLIGMVRILNEDKLYWGAQQEKAKYVHSLVVKEDFNGKGMGAKILQETAMKAKNR